MPDKRHASSVYFLYKNCTVPSLSLGFSTILDPKEEDMVFLSLSPLLLEANSVLIKLGQSESNRSGLLSTLPVALVFS
jgi:hypothetical protein